MIRSMSTMAQHNSMPEKEQRSVSGVGKQTSSPRDHDVPSRRATFRFAMHTNPLVLVAGTAAIVAMAAPLGILLFRRQVRDSKRAASSSSSAVAVGKNVERVINIDVSAWLAADESHEQATPKPATREPQKKHLTGRQLNPRVDRQDAHAPTAKRRLPVPKLPLPATVNVEIYRQGKQTNVLRVVCVGVERTVSRAIGRSAFGTTRPLLDYLFATHGDPSNASVTMYPRTMGYLIANALLNNEPDIGARLVAYQKSGRLASMAAANWRP